MEKGREKMKKIRKGIKKWSIERDKEGKKERQK
jgi:hypothetical protein